MQRLNYPAANPEAFKAMLALSEFVNTNIDHRLLDLVKLRASQINGCAYCCDMHATAARKNGETERRLQTIAAWRDTAFFTPKERAALAWTETLTRLSQQHVTDADFEEVKAHFTDRELTDLSLAIGVINSWNRLSVGFGTMPV